MQQLNKMVSCRSKVWGGGGCYEGKNMTKDEEKNMKENEEKKTNCRRQNYFVCKL